MIRKVAILGAGIGEQHLTAYAALPERFIVTHICDLNEELAKRLADLVGAQFTEDLDCIIADPAIDIIDICLPPPLHVPVALKALAAGKNVILEKPIAGSLADADRLRKAEAESKCQIYPVFQYRFGRAFRILSRLKEQGWLQRPLVASLETHWDRDLDYYAIAWRGTWQHELGGAVLSHAIHAHDLLTMVFGPVASVSAYTTTRVNEIETEDCAAIAFRMMNGATATSSITLGAAGNDSRLKFVFDDLTAESQSGDAFAYAPGMSDWSFKARNPERQHELDSIIAEMEEAPEGFTGFCTAVADALDGRSGSETTLADGSAAIELATAIYQSNRIGEQVNLPIDRDLPICEGLEP